MTDVQARYWRELYDLKVHTGYLECYLGRTEHIDRCVNFGIALTSTGSLGIWAFLKQFEMVWAALIVLSQIASVGKVYLPYSSRLKGLGAAVNEFEEHMIWAEEKFLDVADGALTEKQIAKLRSDIQLKTLKTMRSHFKNSSLPEVQAFLDRATDKADVYFRNYYGGSGNE